MSRNAHKLDDNSKIRTLDVTESTDKRTFADLHLKPGIIKGLNESGFLRPSPVQWSALPLANLGVDLIVQAKSGTGKTLVFVVSALNMVQCDINSVQAILIAPTREIAVQGARAILDVSRGADMNDLKVHTFIGGMSMSDDVVKAKKCHIAIGTPGRIRALIAAKSVKPEAVRLLVLDEADKLMESSFKSDLTWIFNQLPSHKQVIALSATFPEDLEKMVKTFLNQPQLVRLSLKSNVLIGVSQFVISSKSNPLPHIEADLKFKILLDILNSVSFSQCLVFSNYSVRAETICEKLEANGWPVMLLSGIMEQRDRLKALNSLKQFNCRVLITTDLSARGIDAANVNLVINMEVPWDPNTYLHRIGRSGRFGSYGIAISIASEGKEMKSLAEIVHVTSSPIHKLKSDVIPDLWKLKQNQELDQTIEGLELVEGIEPTVEEVKESKKCKEQVEEQVEDYEEVVVKQEASVHYEDYYCDQENGNYEGEDDYEESEEDAEEEEEEISETFLIEAFEKAIGLSVLPIKPGFEQAQKEFKDLFDHYTSNRTPDLQWPIDLSNAKEMQPPPEIDFGRVQELSSVILEHKMNQWSQKVARREKLIENEDVGQVIENLLDDKPLMKLKVKEEFNEEKAVDGNMPPDFLAWQPVDPVEESHDFQGQVLFDQNEAKVDLDEDFYLEHDGIAEEGCHQLFPDPDLGLPGDLYELHKNEWLKMQYHLWLQKVQHNREMIEQHFYMQNNDK